MMEEVKGNRSRGVDGGSCLTIYTMQKQTKVQYLIWNYIVRIWGQYVDGGLKKEAGDQEYDEISERNLSNFTFR